MAPGTEFLQLGEIDSTNEEAKRRIAAGAQDGLVILAERQLSGRGRRGHTWSSPAGNLYMSMVVGLDRPLSEAAQLTFVIAVAICDVIRTWTEGKAETRIKWPNDIFVDRRKLTGILLETEPDPAGDPMVVIGVGVNLVSHPSETEVETPATDLKTVADVEVPPIAFAEMLVPSFQSWRSIWARDGFPPVRDAWIERALGIGERIRVRLGEHTFHGEFLDLGADGAIEVRRKDGTLERITAGDVFFPGGSG